MTLLILLEQSLKLTRDKTLELLQLYNLLIYLVKFLVLLGKCSYASVSNVAHLCPYIVYLHLVLFAEDLDLVFFVELLGLLTKMTHLVD